MRTVLFAVLGVATAHAAEPPAAPASVHSTPYRIEGRGTVLDTTHPRFPGDGTRLNVQVILMIDPASDEVRIEWRSDPDDHEPPDIYFMRRGRIFQADTQGAEVAPQALGDLSPAAIAALHPALATAALRIRPENRTAAGTTGAVHFAWSDALWRVETGPNGVQRLTRPVFHGVLGDGWEEISFSGEPPLTKVQISQHGQAAAQLEFGAPQPAAPPAVPQGDRRRDSEELLGPGPLALTPLAPGVHVVEMAGLNARVFVIEFRDFLVVLEGTYNSLAGDRVVRALAPLKKPIRYFSFSHLHGQYIGGLRSFVAAGATVLVTPELAPLVRQVAAAPHALRPDALAAAPRVLTVEVVDDRRLIEDADNALLLIHNRNSEHTREYLNFYLPRQKILLSGDLYFHRTGKPAVGRSKTFCGTVRQLGLDVDRVYITWPLTGYPIENTISGVDFRAACAD
jgi:glyoxylase-like metal-dependent hydrolase (beta-lactamase superfamily II)